MNSVDHYIEQYPKPVQLLLQQLRQEVAALAPAATEVMRYGLPTFQLHGKNIFHFGAFAKHIGIYPGPEAIAALSPLLTKYQTSKGAIQLPLDQPLPMELVKQLVEFNLTLHSS